MYFSNSPTAPQTPYHIQKPLLFVHVNASNPTLELNLFQGTRSPRSGRRGRERPW